MKQQHNLNYSKFFVVCLIGALCFLGALNVFGAFKKAPNVTFDTFQGKYTLSERRGKTIVLFFAFPG